MSLSTGGTVVIVLLILLIAIVAGVLIFLKCRSRTLHYRPYNPSANKTESAGSIGGHSSSPLVDPKQHPPSRLVIPFTSSTPIVTTIHIPVTGARHLSDTDSSSGGSYSDSEGEEGESDHEVYPRAGGGSPAPVHRVRAPVSDDGFVDDGKDSCGAPGLGAPGTCSSSSDEDQAERDADGEDSASWTRTRNTQGLDETTEVTRPPDFRRSGRSVSTLEGEFEKTAYSVFLHEKEVCTAMSQDQDHATVVDNHLINPPPEKKRRKKRRLSLPHISSLHHGKGDRKSRDGGQLLYDLPSSLHKGRITSSADSVRSNLVKPIGKFFIRIQHKAKEEKLLLFINKAADLNLPERLTLRKGLNPVLYIKGGFLPTMRQRFISKYVPLAEDATWCNEFAIMGVSKSAAWQLAMRLFLCYRECNPKRPQIIGVCDVVLGQMNLEYPQEVVLNFFSSETIYSELGDLHLSVCYQPTLQRIAFLVAEARDLPRSTLFGSIHSVTKVEMISQGRRVGKQKSRLVRETTNPVWDDQLAFNLPAGNSRLHDVQFNVTVMHVDMVKGSHRIGKCELGWSATCEELEHWNDVMRNPNRPMAMWLSLQYPDS